MIQKRLINESLAADNIGT